MLICFVLVVHRQFVGVVIYICKCGLKISVHASRTYPTAPSLYVPLGSACSRSDSVVSIMGSTLESTV